ncbi:MAG: glycosyltransferase family 2 protein [Candidatus Omnitrophica bacterium]|nr:glycosyltransferase family 2 protein [Candidatus Omnitrophota bacterium]
MIKNFCVLIPSYNEAKTIGGIIKELKRRGLTIYVVDDGSIDDTASIAKAEGAVVVTHEKNKGKGASLREGFLSILESDYDCVLVMDGDNQHALSDIDSFFKKMEETNADMVIGNRMLDTSSMPHTRLLVNRFMSQVISRIAAQYIPDSQCGFRLIKRSVLQKIRLESSNYEIESEMIVKAAREGFKIESVPTKTVYQDEKSRINPIVDTIRFVALLLKILLRR